MPKYTVITGDTFDSISNKIYGVPTGVSRIKRANPGVIEPLAGGSILFVPEDLEAAQNKSQKIDADKGVVSMKIGSTTLSIFETTSITLNVDSIDSIAVRIPFDPTNMKIRELLKPFQYKKITVHVGALLLFTGTIINIIPTLTASSNTVEITAYALPGILEDCTKTPEDALSYSGSTLRTIADDLVYEYGFKAKFGNEPPPVEKVGDDESLELGGAIFDGFQTVASQDEFFLIGPPFDNVTLDPTTKILSFLRNLARQRGFIISNTVEGDLLFHRSVEKGKPVCVFEEGSSPLTGVTAMFDGQNYFSDIVGVQTTTPGNRGEFFVEKNNFSDNIYRPFTFTIKDEHKAYGNEVVQTKIARMFANSISYDIEVSTWFDPQGKLWYPNTTVKLLAPSVMIYHQTEFIIRKVELKKAINAETAVLSLVLPGAFSNESPESMPWD